MRDLFILSVYVLVAVAGLMSPAMAAFGYIWVDIFTPQRVSWMLGGWPVSLVMAGICVVSWLMHPKERGKLPKSSGIQIALALWMTATLAWAAVPGAAVVKWDWAFKTVFFMAFIPAFLKSRRDLNVIVWAIVLSGMTHCMPMGAKTIISGGGYGVDLGLIGANTGWGESSTIAVFASMLIPLCVWLMRHDELLPAGRLKNVALGGCVVLILGAVMGSFARAGVLAVTAVGASMLLLNRQRGLTVLLVLAGLAVFSIGGEAWQDRMLTIGDANETSAAGRVSVWLWTLEYVARHPFGGSFDVYRINSFERVLPSGEVLVIQAKAFHSIYFETLGELGIVGFGLFMTLLVGTLIRCIRERRASADPVNVWRRDLASAIACSIVGFMVGASFVGVAFQSAHYILIALMGTLSQLPRGGRTTDVMRRA